MSRWLRPLFSLLSIEEKDRGRKLRERWKKADSVHVCVIVKERSKQEAVDERVKRSVWMLRDSGWD